MKSTGIIRPVDEMGRVVIPKELRAQLQIENGIDKFEIYMENNRIILEKYRPACLFCNRLNACINYNGYTVCESCIEELYKKKEIAR